jgi:hypothetical protein
MKQEIEMNEWIESYLNGNLPAGEVATFRKKLEEDPGFAREVELHKQLREIITDGTYLNIKSKLKSIHREKTRINRRINRITGFGVGGLLIGVILLLVLPGVFNTEKEKKEQSVIINTRVDSNAIADQTNTEAKKTPEKAGMISSHVPPGDQVADNEKVQKPPNSVDTAIAPEITHKEIPAKNKETEPDEPGQKPVIKNVSAPEKVTEAIQADCHKIKIEGNFVESESCSSKPTGSVAVDGQSVTGGLPPYTFSLNPVDFRDTLLFSGLYPGSYPLYAKDAHDCISRIGIALIRSVDCGTTYQAVFTPMKGEIWTVPTDPDKDGTLSIFSSKTGTLVFTVRFTVGETILWNGTTSSGQPLPMGLYQFEIQYSDEERFTGNVTIIK